MPRSLYSRALLVSALALGSSLAAQDELGPFFEPEQPFFQTQVEITPGSDAGDRGNFVVRGIVLPLASGHAVIFDQELLRVAALAEVPEGEPPVTLRTMPQISYRVARRKASGEHPKPSARVLVHTGMHPGVAGDAGALFNDPRPAGRPGDLGRGALPVDFARFEGIELTGVSPVLHYRSGGTKVREWHQAATVDGVVRFHRHFSVEPHDAPLVFAIGSVDGGWILPTAQTARAESVDDQRVLVATSSRAFTLAVEQDELVATLASSAETQHVTLVMVFGDERAAGPDAGETVAATPAPSGPPAELRWPENVEAPAELAVIEANGFALDRIAVPEDNPWKRRVRSADLAFLDANRAAVVTYDGDVWLAEGFAAGNLGSLTWRRFCSGLHEPLALAATRDGIVVATKNGLVRLHDRDGNGEADWFENFSDGVVQSQTTRSFPLDLAVAPDGSFFTTQGGIVDGTGIESGGSGTVHSGAILRISPDGRSVEAFATAAREPFVAVHPETGLVTATDQQGHWIPSSAVYLVRRGDSFGFPFPNPEQLTPPLLWLPHDQDSSSSSQVWMVGDGMGPWRGKLLHLSYGTGRLFLITPDLDAPVPQGAATSLGLQTDLPLLHARMHPSGDSVWLAGFQIYGTRTGTRWALGRLRPVADAPVTTPIAARSVRDGVILEFASPLDVSSLRAENVNARIWNYRRSAEYGSGRYAPDGEPGAPPFGVGAVVASHDGRHVFIHLPDLPDVMQLEVRTHFRLSDGTPAESMNWFTIHQAVPVDLAKEGFGDVDLDNVQTVIAPLPEPDPSRELGEKLAQTLGCVACHSTDGSGGRIGPTWRGLFGSKRTFLDGTSDRADTGYLREKILNPMARPLREQVEMPSYRGVITDNQLESLILYIKSLR